MSQVKVGFPFTDSDIRHFTFEDKSTVKITVDSQHNQVVELFNVFLKMQSVASHEVVQHVWRCNQQPTQPSHKVIIIKLFSMKIQSTAKHKPWSCSTVWRQSQQPTQPSHEVIKLLRYSQQQSTSREVVQLFEDRVNSRHNQVMKFIKLLRYSQQQSTSREVVQLFEDRVNSWHNQVMKLLICSTWRCSRQQTQVIKLFSKQRWLVVCCRHQMWNEGCNNEHLNWLQ